MSSQSAESAECHVISPLSETNSFETESPGGAVTAYDPRLQWELVDDEPLNVGDESADPLNPDPFASGSQEEELGGDDEGG